MNWSEQGYNVHADKLPYKEACAICGGKITRTQVYKEADGKVYHKGCYLNKRGG